MFIFKLKNFLITYLYNFNKKIKKYKFILFIIN